MQSSVSTRESLSVLTVSEHGNENGDDYTNKNNNNNNSDVDDAMDKPIAPSADSSSSDPSDPYDISSMSTEDPSVVRGSPSFERAKSSPPRRSPDDDGTIPELDASPSFPPSPFPALPPPLNSTSSLGHSNNNNNSSNNNNNNGGIHTSPRFKPPTSPAGSNSSLGSPTVRSSHGYNNIPSSSSVMTQQQQQQQQQVSSMNMPRFYDSEEDGPGSLVFVESGSASGIKESSGGNSIVPLSPQHSQHSSINNNNGHPHSRFFGEKQPLKVPMVSLSRQHSSISSNNSNHHPSLLPYPQRRKMAILGEQSAAVREGCVVHEEGHRLLNRTESGGGTDSKKPPTAPQSSQPTNTTTANLLSMAEKYKVPPIPVFRSNHRAANDDEDDNSAVMIVRRPSEIEDRRRRSSSPSHDGNSNVRPPLADSGNNSSGGNGNGGNNNNSNNTTTTKQQQRQQVIHGPSPPASPRDSSPETSSFHIRCNSQTSISSLGSNAVDSVKGGGNGSAGDRNNNLPTANNIQMYKQFPQGYGGYTNAHWNMMPQTMNPYGYVHQQQQQHPQQQFRNMPQPPPKSNSGVAGFDGLNALDRDIATFLHGERIAAQTNGNNNSASKPQPPTSAAVGVTVSDNHSYWKGYRQGAGIPPPPPPPPMPVWQGHNNPYQQHNAQPPPPYHDASEPTPPPLTSVPNMELRRARLPSISDDDWAEELEKINREDYDEDEGMDRERPNKKEWEFRMRQQQQQQQLQQSLYGPNNPNQSVHNLYPNMRGYYHHPMQQQHHQHPMPYYNMSLPPEYRYRDNASPHERSKLLDHHHHAYPSNYNDMRGNNNNNNSHGYPSSNLRRDESEQRQSLRKKKKSRRREKSKRMQQQQNTAADSTDEDVESERRTAGTTRSRRSRRHRRKKRDHGAADTANHTLDDTLSDTLSESYMSQSLGEQYSSTTYKPIRAGFCRRISVRTKLLLCNMPLSAGAISFSVVLLGTLWFKWAEELLSSCKEVTFHSSQCNLPDFPGAYAYIFDFPVVTFGRTFLSDTLNV